MGLTSSNSKISHPLSSRSDSNGYWIVDLGNLKDNNSQQVLSYEADDVMSVRAEAVPDWVRIWRRVVEIRLHHQYRDVQMAVPVQ